MLDTLAHHPDPYPLYDELRTHGVHQVADGRWVVATAAAVTAVLSNPHALVRDSPPTDPVQALMARFSDGEDHDRRRAIAITALAAVTPIDLRRRASELTSARIAGLDEVDVMELARHVPVATLAEALGIGPELAVADPSDEVAVNTMALLFQTMDATAGLIGNAVVGEQAFSATSVAHSAFQIAENAVRMDPSVQLTTRFTRAAIEVGGTTIPAGEQIVVLLAAANRDPAADGKVFTFGVGLRPCPGSNPALALAAGVLDALHSRELVDTTVRYEPRPNLRIPVTLRIHSGP